MKHTKYFEDFLKKQVDLNQTRLNLLNRRVETVTELLESKLDGYRKYVPQGSYAQGTIIKPVADNDEFDADLLVFVRDKNFNPNKFREDYVKEVCNVLENDGTYKGKVRLKTRCATVDYSGDFHLDIVPCVEHQGCFYICNRNEKEYEQTDGGKYAEWFSGKNGIVGENYLRKVVRLFKFLRDHKNTFSIKSILLTTLLGTRVFDYDKGSSEFSDLPQALKTLSNRMNDFLRANPTMPKIENPVLLWEDFTRSWDETKYKNFRDKFDMYNRKINEAFEEKDHNKSVRKWREIFGDDFGKLKDSNRAAVAPSVIPHKPYASHD